MWSMPSWSDLEEGYDYYKGKGQDLQSQLPKEADTFAKWSDPFSYYAHEATRRSMGSEGLKAPYNMTMEKLQGSKFNKDSSSSDPLGKIKGDIYPKKPTIGAGGFYDKGTDVSSTPYGQITGQQSSLADTLKARAMGKAPSIAETSAAQAQDKNIAQAMALAMSQPNSPLGRRAAMQQQALAGQNIARDLSNARLSELESAQTQYRGLLDSMSRTQSERDIAAMQDRRARELAEAELLYKQDIARSGLNRQMYGAAFDVLGAGFETFSNWLQRNPNGTQSEYMNEIQAKNIPTATGGVPSEYPPSFGDSIDNYPPEGQSGIYDLPSTAPAQPETVFPTSGESMALTGRPQQPSMGLWSVPDPRYARYSSYGPFYDYRRY
jgi:hypothetical protein